MFRNAQLDVRGGSFTQVNRDYNQYNHYNTHVSPEVRREEALKRLFDHIAPGALHNSADRRDPPKCHPRTREAVIRDILTWAQNPANLRLLMWIYGPAGAGKSAIMQTIAELCDELEILGGSFFFLRRAQKRDVADHLITTIAFQLARRVPHFADHLAATIHSDPSIFSKNLGLQMKALILNPMAAIAVEDPNSSQQLYVILIDGLDECCLESSQREIINLLSCSASPQLRFIISSRPELTIRTSFSDSDIQRKTQTLALDDHYLPDDDIRKFLEDKFCDIKKNHIMHHSLPETWPGASIMDKLVRNSSGQFIYIATVIRYIESERHNPMEHLATILKAQLPPEESDRPFALLDSLYHHIFAAVANITAVLDIFQILLSLFNWGFNHSTSWIETSLNYSPGQAQLILCDMHSLLKLEHSSSLDSDSVYIKLHHKSLEDFLSDPLRSGNLYIDPEESILISSINTLNHFSALASHFPYPEASQVIKVIFHDYIWQDVHFTMLGNTLLRCIPNISKASIESEGHMRQGWYTALMQYYWWLDNQTHLSSNPLVTQLYNGAIEWLDALLSDTIFKSWQADNLPAIIFWVYALKLSFQGSLVSFIKSDYEPERGPRSLLASNSLLNLDLKKLITDPSKKTKQILDTLCDPNIAQVFIKYLLRVGSWSKDLQHPFCYRNQKSPRDATWQCIVEYLPHISPDQALGEKITRITQPCSKNYWASSIIFYENCPVGKSQCINHEMCQQFQKYNAQLHFKQLQYTFSHVCRDYLQKCSMHIETHEYNSNHYMCFSCQSTEAFLEDPDYFEAHQISFAVKKDTDEGESEDEDDE